LSTNIEHIDLQVMWDFLRKCMRANASSGDPTRFAISQLVHEHKDENGDVEEPADIEELRSAVCEFRGLPFDEQRRLLGGWNHKVIDVHRSEHMKRLAGWPLRPVLTMWAGGRGDRDRAIGEFDAIYDEDARTCRIFIKAGSTKAEVLDALETLAFQIDSDWDRLITDPLDRENRVTQMGGAK
jgi:hypothetical protein